MAKMLDREKVLDFIKEYADAAPVGKEAKMALRALGVCLCGFPNVDAEPVVRCGECKHMRKEAFFDVNFVQCELAHNALMPDDWYCADGAKMDGDEHAAD